MEENTTLTHFMPAFYPDLRKFRDHLNLKSSFNLSPLLSNEEILSGLSVTLSSGMNPYIQSWAPSATPYMGCPCLEVSQPDRPQSDYQRLPNTQVH
jgi:hypothetical protein